MFKEKQYRVGDQVQIRKVSLELPENIYNKISMPEQFRGMKGTVLQIRTFEVKPKYQDTVVVEFVIDGQTCFIATEQHHIRLLRRGPKPE